MVALLIVLHTGLVLEGVHVFYFLTCSVLDGPIDAFASGLPTCHKLPYLVLGIRLVLLGFTGSVLPDQGNIEK
ncbi:hypothetical protein J5N97_018951 [Dioscorea zingiberensis]|uniref:Uncharacterized protein n=1 Tax=Dioscorea zingiberensis TaxID=325984 RepID=A0A9D5CE33_9LILI|nr:hypothetical protein J5N97_018951 [Dioscorea zingiberensis]